MIDFRGQVAIVTGAGKGIGREIALALATRGASVVVNNRSRDGADSAGQTVDAIIAGGGSAVAERSSVESAGAADSMVATAMDNFGQLDMVVANAAIVDRATFGKTVPDRFREVMEIDFMAPVALARAALPEITKNAGRFLFVTSAAGTYGEYGVTSYAAAKGALSAFAKTLAIEGRRSGVRSNLLAPFALTQMTEDFVPKDQGSDMDPSFVVPAAIWLLNPQTEATGQTIVAAGNRFRVVITGETLGRAFPVGQVVTDERFAVEAESLFEFDSWESYSDGMAAFVGLMSMDGDGGAT
jgi:NAD(P)-dependent dehydrogenase (short-subunit alcohol dehydrogenase family)